MHIMDESTDNVPKSSTFYYSYRPAGNVIEQFTTSPAVSKSSKNSKFDSTEDDSTEISFYYSNSSCSIDNCSHQFKTANQRNKLSHLFHKHFKQKFDEEYGEMFAIPKDSAEDNLGTLACPDCNYTVEKNLQNLKYHYFSKHGALEKYLSDEKKSRKCQISYYSNSSCTFENCNYQFKFKSKNNKMTHLYNNHFKDKFDEEYGEIFPILLDTEDNSTTILSCPDCDYTVEKKLPILKCHYFIKHGVVEKYLAAEEESKTNHSNLISIPETAPKKTPYFSNSSCTFENCDHQFEKLSQSNIMTHLYYKHFKEKFDEEYGEKLAILLDKEDNNLQTLSCPDCNYTVEKKLQCLKNHYFTKHNVLEKYLAAEKGLRKYPISETAPNISTYRSYSTCTFENCNQQFKKYHKNNKKNRITHLYYKHFKLKFDEEYGELFTNLMDTSVDNLGKLTCPMDCDYTVEKNMQNLQNLKYHYFTKHGILEKYLEAAGKNLNFISILDESTEIDATKNFTMPTCKLCGLKFSHNRKNRDIARHLFKIHFQTKFNNEYGSLIEVDILQKWTFSCPIENCNFQSSSILRRRDAMEHVYISHGIMKEYYDQCDGSIINDVYINMPKKSIKIETPISDLPVVNPLSFYCEIKDCDYQFKTPSKGRKVTHLYTKHFIEKFEQEYGEMLMSENYESYACPDVDCDYQDNINTDETLKQSPASLMHNLKFHYFTKHGVLEKYLADEVLEYKEDATDETSVSLAMEQQLGMSCKICGYTCKPSTNKNNTMARHLYSTHFKSKFLEEYDYIIPKNESLLKCPMPNCEFQNSNEAYKGRKILIEHIYDYHGIMKQYHDQYDINKSEINDDKLSKYFVSCDIEDCSDQFSNYYVKTLHLYGQHFKAKFQKEFGTKLLENGGVGCPECNYQRNINNGSSSAQSEARLNLHYFTKHGILEKYLNELVNEQSNSNENDAVQNECLSVSSIKMEKDHSPNKEALKKESLIKSPNNRKRKIPFRESNSWSDFKRIKSISDLKILKGIALLQNEQDDDQFHVESNDFSELNDHKEDPLEVKKTQVVLTINSDKVYQIKIPKAVVSLGDIKQHLLKRPEKYFISQEGITQYAEFRAKTTINGKDCFEEYDNEDDDTILPFQGDKILLECWSS